MRTYRLGVGVKSIPRKRLTAEKLAKAIDQAVHNLDMRQRAAEIGALVRAEDGVGQAVALMGQLLNRPVTTQVERYVR
jgi:sterol 3beta-glucosyltransferase